MSVRRKSLLVAVLALLIALSVTGVALAGGNARKGSETRAAARQPASAPVSLSASQADELLYLLEEEKLARDVYRALYEKWGEEAFSKISTSESRHMTSVQRLVERYGLALPQTLATPRTYDDAELQQMYADLMARGGASLDAALEVGVMIETVDIEDLQRLLASDGLPRDVDRVAGNLLKGSQNHLASFERLLAE